MYFYNNKILFSDDNKIAMSQNCCCNKCECVSNLKCDYCEHTPICFTVQLNNINDWPNGEYHCIQTYNCIWECVDNYGHITIQIDEFKILSIIITDINDYVLYSNNFILNQCCPTSSGYIRDSIYSYGNTSINTSNVTWRTSASFSGNAHSGGSDTTDICEAYYRNNTPPEIGCKEDTFYFVYRQEGVNIIQSGSIEFNVCGVDYLYTRWMCDLDAVSSSADIRVFLNDSSSFYKRVSGARRDPERTGSTDGIVPFTGSTGNTLYFYITCSGQFTNSLKFMSATNTGTGSMNSDAMSRLDILSVTASSYIYLESCCEDYQPMDPP